MKRLKPPTMKLGKPIPMLDLSMQTGPARKGTIEPMTGALFICAGAAGLFLLGFLLVALVLTTR